VTSSRHLKSRRPQLRSVSPHNNDLFRSGSVFPVAERLSTSLATVYAKMPTVEDVRQRENDVGEEVEEEVLDYVVERAGENSDDEVGPGGLWRINS
jgi:hypothetical protein